VNKFLLGWIVDYVLKALIALFGTNPASDPVEHFPEGHPDAQPSHPKPKKPVLLPNGDDWLKRLMNGKKAKR
jgi:hypothetical protein